MTDLSRTALVLLFCPLSSLASGDPCGQQQVAQPLSAAMRGVRQASEKLCIQAGAQEQLQSTGEDCNAKEGPRDAAEATADYLEKLRRQCEQAAQALSAAQVACDANRKASEAADSIAARAAAMARANEKADDIQRALQAGKSSTAQQLADAGARGRSAADRAREEGPAAGAREAAGKAEEAAREQEQRRRKAVSEAHAAWGACPTKACDNAAKKRWQEKVREKKDGDRACQRLRSERDALEKLREALREELQRLAQAGSGLSDAAMAKARAFESNVGSTAERLAGIKSLEGQEPLRGAAPPAATPPAEDPKSTLPGVPETAPPDPKKPEASEITGADSRKKTEQGRVITDPRDIPEKFSGLPRDGRIGDEQRNVKASYYDPTERHYWKDPNDPSKKQYWKEGMRTAASNFYPEGSWLEVTNNRTGATTEVLVTDSGFFRPARSGNGYSTNPADYLSSSSRHVGIDLSPAAARDLGMIGRGPDSGLAQNVTIRRIAGPSGRRGSSSAGRSMAPIPFTRGDGLSAPPVPKSFVAWPQFSSGVFSEKGALRAAAPGSAGASGSFEKRAGATGSNAAAQRNGASMGALFWNGPGGASGIELEIIPALRPEQAGRAPAPFSEDPQAVGEAPWKQEEPPASPASGIRTPGSLPMKPRLSEETLFERTHRKYRMLELRSTQAAQNLMD